MSHIKITKGVDIPIKGKPVGNPKYLQMSGESSIHHPNHVSLNLDFFEDIKFRLLIKEGDTVKIGQPLAEDKARAGRYFVSPAGGTIKEIRRGLKRRLLDIVIEVSQNEESYKYPSLDPKTAIRQELLARFLESGLFTKIRRRPFNLLADPEEIPRAVFIKAIESAPFAPPAEMQVQGHEQAFKVGIEALHNVTERAPIHLVYAKDSHFKPFTEDPIAIKHTAEGPHPIGTHSVHIHYLDPIKSPSDCVWTLNVHDVVVIGEMLLNGTYFNERIVSIAGPGILEGRTGYFHCREGLPIHMLISGRVEKGDLRFISGDPLTGKKVSGEDFLGFNHYTFCVIPESEEREFLHFFRLGIDKYTVSGTYLSGHLNNRNRVYDFTTSLHGEERAFIDSTMYEKVMPMRIPTMHLAKAVMAEDYDLAEEYGLLEVDSEDFALATFVCPSKMEMTEIIKSGLKTYAKQVLH